jgi:desulfoferrodoxin (superoxide reductase-like protein)
MFYGLIIRMFYAPKEHNPPHIHVEYQGEESLVDIATGTVMEGHLSSRHLHFIHAWIEIHKEELLADWNLCQNGEEPFKIDPLR